MRVEELMRENVLQDKKRENQERLMEERLETIESTKIKQTFQVSPNKFILFETESGGNLTSTVRRQSIFKRNIAVQ